MMNQTSTFETHTFTSRATISSCTICIWNTTSSTRIRMKQYIQAQIEFVPVSWYTELRRFWTKSFSFLMMVTFATCCGRLLPFQSIRMPFASPWMGTRMTSTRDTHWRMMTPSTRQLSTGSTCSFAHHPDNFKISTWTLHQTRRYRHPLLHPFRRYNRPVVNEINTFRHQFSFV